MLEIAVDALEGHRTSIEDRVLSYVNQNRLGPETAIEMNPEYAELQRNLSSRSNYSTHTSHHTVLSHDVNNENNQNANRDRNSNQNAISVQNPVPSPKKRRSLMDVFQGFKSRKNNPAVQMTYSDSSDSESSESDSDSTETSSLLQSGLHRRPIPNYQSNLTVPPPPMVPPLSRFSSFNSTEMPDRFLERRNRNENSNLSCLQSLPTIPEESFEQDRDSQNTNNNMGLEENPLLEEGIWLNRLKDALLDSNLNLVIEDHNVILETPGDCTLTDQSRESLIESLQGLLLLCKDRNQAMMLSNIVFTLQQLGHLGTEEKLISDLQHLYQCLPGGENETDESEIDAAWKKIWANEGENSSTVRGYKVIADRDTVKEFTIKLCEKISEFAKESIKTGNANVPLEDLQRMLRSFLASNPRIKTMKPHQAYFLQNISTEGTDLQRRHSDSSLNEPVPKEREDPLLEGKCSSETSILSGRANRITTGTGLSDRPSITDIHEQMGLRPVTRKLSDSVMCVAFDKNTTLIEQQASELLRKRSESRENVLNEIFSEVLPEETSLVGRQKEEEEVQESVSYKV